MGGNEPNEQANGLRGGSLSTRTENTVSVANETFGIARWSRAEATPNLGTVLALHGFPDIPATFEPVAQLLTAAGYDVVAPWLRGYAPSPLHGPFGMAQLGRDVCNVARVVSPGERVTLLGHDWGAIASYAAVSQEPALFSSAVTMAVPHPGSVMTQAAKSWPQIRRSWYALFLGLPWLPEWVVPMRDCAFIDRLWRDWSPNFDPDPAHMREIKLCIRQSMPGPAAHYRAMVRPYAMSANREAVRQMSRLEVPWLSLHGADDGCVSEDMGAGQEQFFGERFESVVMPDVGHFLHLEAPAELARILCEWLRDVPVDGRS